MITKVFSTGHDIPGIHPGGVSSHCHAYYYCNSYTDRYTKTNQDCDVFTNGYPPSDQHAQTYPHSYANQLPGSPHIERPIGWLPHPTACFSQ